MKNKLKLEIDRPTLACILVALGRWSDSAKEALAIADEDMMDWPYLAEFSLALEWMEEMRQTPGDSWRFKCGDGLAFALRHLIADARPVDAWTNVELGRLLAEIDAHLYNHAIPKIKRLPGAVGIKNLTM